jgi:hypothetical protein
LLESINPPAAREFFSSSRGCQQSHLLQHCRLFSF